MAFHHTFPIGNMTLGLRLCFSQTRFSILVVTFRVFFIILLSFKKNKISSDSKTVFKMVFQKYKKRVSPSNGKRIIAKVHSFDLHDQ